MPSNVVSSSLALAAVVLFVASVQECHAQGRLSAPRSRGIVLGYTAAQIYGGSGPSVCGDPHTGSGDLGIVSKVAAVQATYMSGSIIAISYQIGVHQGGFFQVKVCPTARVDADQACFDRYELMTTDSGYTRWWMQTRLTTYTSRWRLPEDVVCAEGCLLQVTYSAASSCVPECGEGECGKDYAAGVNPITRTTPGKCSANRTVTTFKDCADIAITPISV